ncbi:hypothetical protein ACIP5Y_23625 [Nocardia sp. NPDC088792]|uniref:hypothetical protein n=1 Tax=Nocardia sp. NPDC088792 TaxID=3364332 RepID=UPI0037FC78E5
MKLSRLYAVSSTAIGIGFLTAAGALGGAGDAAAEPVANFGFNVGGTGIDHWTLLPSGAFYGGDLLTFTPGTTGYYAGLVFDLNPFSGHCVTGKITFYTQDGTAEEHRTGAACGLPAAFIGTTDRPTGDYTEFCPEVTVDQYHTRSCFPRN